jgi:type II restriction enzyme
MLSIEARQIEGFKFVWFTDGAGWKSARQNLRETFEVLPNLYNIKEIEDGVMQRIFV